MIRIASVSTALDGFSRQDPVKRRDCWSGQFTSKMRNRQPASAWPLPESGDGTHTTLAETWNDALDKMKQC